MKRWTKQADTLLLAHAMSLAEVAELLERSAEECLARAEELDIDLGRQATADAAPPDVIVLQLAPELAAELTEAATAAGLTLEQFARQRLREGFGAYVPDQRLPELPDSGFLVDQCERGRNAMTLAQAEAVARRVLVQLYRGAIEYARQALESGWESHLGENEPLPAGRRLLDEPLSRVIEDVRLLNQLERNGIVTVGQFLECGSVWQSLAGIGPQACRFLSDRAAMLRQRALKGVA